MQKNTKIIFIRLCGVVISSFTAFFSIRILNNYSVENSSTLIGFLAWLVFTPIFQFGFGRPSYTEIRSRYIDNVLNNLLIKSFLKLFTFQSIVASLFFGFLAILIGYSQGYNKSIFGLFFFALGIASLGSCSLLKDISYSIDKELTFELLEIIRRSFLLVIYLLLSIKISFTVVGILGIIIAITTHYIQLKSTYIITTSNNDKTTEWKKIKPNIYIKAKQFLGFSVNELILYNAVLVAMTVKGNSQNIIFMGIWAKIFLLMTLPMRIYVDSSINSITKKYYTKKKKETWNELIKCLKIGLIVLVINISLLGQFSVTLFKWLNADFMNNEIYFLAAICLWSVGNLIQHIFGSFLISNNDSFKEAYKFSLIAMLTISIPSIYCTWNNYNISLIMFIIGILYICTALLYSFNSRSILIVK